MTEGFVIDADVISRFIQEMAEEEGDFFQIISTIEKEKGIAYSDRIEAEWKNCIGCLLFNTWFEDGLKSGSIRYVDNPNVHPHIMRRIINEFGLPQRRGDKHLIRCANSTETKYIVAIDMHLFDPKLCQSSPQAKRRARDERRGSLCRFLARELDIIVGTPFHVRDYDYKELFNDIS